MNLKKIVLLIMSYIMISVISLAYINISPTTLDKNIGLGAYEEYTFYNNTNIPLRYKLSVLPMENKSINDMTDWVEIYPKVVTIYPTEQKTFKVYIKAPKEAEKGDYGTFINIRQVSAPKLESGEQKNIAAGMAVMVNVNMGIYGYIGDKNPKINLINPLIIKKNDFQNLKMNIENKTNRLVRMLIEVKSKKNYVYKIGELRAMKGQILEFENIIPNIKKDEIVKEIIITDVETEKLITKIKIN